MMWFLHISFNPRLNKIHGLEIFYDPRPFTRDILHATRDTRPLVKLSISEMDGYSET
jgi:hypothetical protein